MKTVANILNEALRLCYPHFCSGCGKDDLQRSDLICTQCMHDLPYTNFELVNDNPVVDVLKIRLTLASAASTFYFHKGNIIQNLLHELKYKQNREIGLYLGELMGKKLLENSRYKSVDALLPLPLYTAKELQRGYNQAALICQGISLATNIPVLNDILIRKRATETQTRKHRAERWENVAGSFSISDAKLLENKQVLLVDDVLTTGATLEAAGTMLSSVAGIKLHILTAAFAKS